MFLSQLIKELQAIQEKNGDIALAGGDGGPLLVQQFDQQVTESVVRTQFTLDVNVHVTKTVSWTLRR